MTCIKTGAQVYFANYGVVVAADIFSVAGAVVVRTNGNIDGLGRSPDETYFTHTIYSEPLNKEFWRPDLGVFVVPEHCLMEKEL